MLNIWSPRGNLELERFPLKRSLGAVQHSPYKDSLALTGSSAACTFFLDWHKLPIKPDEAVLQTSQTLVKCNFNSLVRSPQAYLFNFKKKSMMLLFNQ